MESWLKMVFIVTYGVLIGAMLVAARLPKKKFFWLYMIVIVVLVAFVWIAYGQLFMEQIEGRGSTFTVVCNLIPFIGAYVITVLTVLLCFRCNLWIALLCASFGACLQHIGNNLQYFTSLVFSYGDWFFLVVYGVEYVIFAIVIFANKKSEFNYIVADYRWQVILSVVTICLINVVYPYFYSGLLRSGLSPEVMHPLAIIWHVLLTVCAVLIIVLQLTIMRSKKQRTDIERLELVLLEKENQYQIEKTVIESINIKCHDLRHQINALENNCDIKAIEEMRDVIDKYDEIITTGNEAIDTVLTQKNMYCVKNDIKLSCMLNGHNFDYMRPSELYALFGNAMENAINAIEKLPKEKRIISIVEKIFGGFSVTKISNYFDEDEMQFEDGLPITKKDKSSHGFGLKSMKMLVEKYSGRLKVTTENELFILEIFLPVQT